MPTFDWIIVGAGPAGCLIASEWLRRSDAKILLLEAGSLSPTVPRRPADYLRAFGGALDGGLQTETQPGLAGRKLAWPRGRGLGGSTLINAMIWCPPTAADLQSLVDQAGDNWTLPALQADLRKVEQQMEIEAPRWISEATRRYMTAAENASPWLAGKPCIYRRSNRFGRRRTPADLLLETIAEQATSNRRANIEIRSATVDRIVWDRDRARGVLLAEAAGRAPEEVLARSGVVISAGTIQSPAILLRSGIGAAAALAEAGIPRRVELPGVGQNLADHLVMPVTWSTPPAARFPTAWSMSDLARWMHAGSGPIGSNLAEAGGFFSLPPAASRPDGHGRLQLHVTPTDYLRHPDPSAPAAMTIAVTDCSPQSRGRIGLNSRAPLARPVVEPNYLSELRDRQVLIEGIRLVRQLAQDPPLVDWLGPERLPGAKRQTDGELLRAIQRYAQTLYHPVGTCRLGGDRRSVVSSRFRVRQTEGLWVCDASVLPGPPEANPTALICMLARRLARSLAGEV